MFQHLGHRETNVFGDLAQKNWRDVAAGVKRNRSGTARAVSKLLVRTTLPHFDEAKPSQNRYDFGRLENRDVSHDSGDCDVLDPDELRFKNGVAVFEKHCNDLPKVRVQFIERGALGVRSGKPGNKPDEKTGIGVSLNYGGIGLHRADSGARSDNYRPGTIRAQIGLA